MLEYPPVLKPKAIANGTKTARPVPPPTPHIVTAMMHPKAELATIAVAGRRRCGNVSFVHTARRERYSHL